VFLVQIATSCEINCCDLKTRDFDENGNDGIFLLKWVCEIWSNFIGDDLIIQPRFQLF